MESKVGDKHYFSVCLFGRFWKRLTFELVDEQRSSLHACQHHPICWRPEQNNEQRKNRFAVCLFRYIYLLLPLGMTAVVLRPLRLTFLGLQFTDGRSWSLNTDISKSYNSILKNLCNKISRNIGKCLSTKMTG